MRKCGSTKDIQCMNGTKRKLAYKYTRMYKYEKCKRALTSLLRGNPRGMEGAWKDVALDGRLEIHATAAPL